MWTRGMDGSLRMHAWQGELEVTGVGPISQEMDAIQSHLVSTD